MPLYRVKLTREEGRTIEARSDEDADRQVKEILWRENLHRRPGDVLRARVKKVTKACKKHKPDDDGWCDVCRRYVGPCMYCDVKAKHRHCPECGALDHAAANCEAG